MSHYQVEAWAFGLNRSQQIIAWQIVADAFEEAGDLLGANVRRSWARTIKRGYKAIRSAFFSWLGDFWCLETGFIFQTLDGAYNTHRKVSPKSWYFGKYKHEQPSRYLSKKVL